MKEFSAAELDALMSATTPARSSASVRKRQLGSCGYPYADEVAQETAAAKLVEYAPI